MPVREKIFKKHFFFTILQRPPGVQNRMVWVVSCKVLLSTNNDINVDTVWTAITIVPQCGFVQGLPSHICGHSQHKKGYTCKTNGKIRQTSKKMLNQLHIKYKGTQTIAMRLLIQLYTYKICCTYRTFRMNHILGPDFTEVGRSGFIIEFED